MAFIKLNWQPAGIAAHINEMYVSVNKSLQWLPVPSLSIAVEIQQKVLEQDGGSEEEV